MIITEFVKELLFPRKCIFCGKVLSPDETDLCHDCRTSGPEYEGVKRVPGISRVTAVWFYEGNVRESLLRFKFQHRPDYAEPFGRMLAMKILREKPEYDLITWVPVSEKRRRERGFDQSELLARAAAQELGAAVKPTLKKLRDNPAQSGIDDAEQRKANVLGVYAVMDEAAVRDKRVLLMDDILTTGATAGECAKMLRAAGAKEVSLAVVAGGRKHKKESLL